MQPSLQNFLQKSSANVLSVGVLCFVGRVGGERVYSNSLKNMKPSEPQHQLA